MKNCVDQERLPEVCVVLPVMQEQNSVIKHVPKLNLISKVVIFWQNIAVSVKFLRNAHVKEWIMEALFRNTLYFTTFLFYLVKFSTQGIIPSKRDSVFVLSGKI